MCVGTFGRWSVVPNHPATPSIRANGLGIGGKTIWPLRVRVTNVYAVRKADLSDAKKRDIYTRFLAGVVMGFEFARANPKAAAQITYGQLPALQSIISPQVALESMAQLASGYSLEKRHGGLWGSFNVNAWNSYLATIAKLGQVKKQYSFHDVVDTSLIAAANKRANVARARRDARAFKLDKYFSKTKLPKGLPL